jgi:hypothetical protein
VPYLEGRPNLDFSAVYSSSYNISRPASHIVQDSQVTQSSLPPTDPRESNAAISPHQQGDFFTCNTNSTVNKGIIVVGNAASELDDNVACTPAGSEASELSGADKPTSNIEEFPTTPENGRYELGAFFRRNKNGHKLPAMAAPAELSMHRLVPLGRHDSVLHDDVFAPSLDSTTSPLSAPKLNWKLPASTEQPNRTKKLERCTGWSSEPEKLYFTHGTHVQAPLPSLTPATNRSCLTVIEGLPPSTDLRRLLNFVRGGKVVNAKLVTGLRIRSTTVDSNEYPNTKTAVIRLDSAKGAAEYARFFINHSFEVRDTDVIHPTDPFCLGFHTLWGEADTCAPDSPPIFYYPTVRLGLGTSYPLADDLQNEIELRSLSRFLEADKFPQHAVAALLASPLLGYYVRHRDTNAILDVDYNQQTGTLVIEFADISLARKTFKLIMADKRFRSDIARSQPRSEDDTRYLKDPSAHNVTDLKRFFKDSCGSVLHIDSGHHAVPPENWRARFTHSDYRAKVVVQAREEPPPKTYTLNEWAAHTKLKQDLTWYLKKRESELTADPFSFMHYDDERKVCRYGPEAELMTMEDFWKAYEYDNEDSDDPVVQEILDLRYASTGRFNPSRARRIMGRWYAPSPLNLWGILKGNK